MAPKLTDPGELETIKEVYGFEGIRPKAKTETVERTEIKTKKQINQSR